MCSLLTGWCSDGLRNRQVRRALLRVTRLIPCLARRAQQVEGASRGQMRQVWPPDSLQQAPMPRRAEQRTAEAGAKHWVQCTIRARLGRDSRNFDTVCELI
jgi:hypothetical protein